MMVSRAAIAVLAIWMGAGCSCKKSTPTERSPAPAKPAPPAAPAPTASVDWLPEDKLVETVIALNSHVVAMSLSPEFTDYRTTLATIERVSGQPAHPFVFTEATLDGGHGVAIKGVDPARWNRSMTLSNYIESGTADLSTDRDGFAPALIGAALANRLSVKVGDAVRLPAALSVVPAYGPADASPPPGSAQQVRVAGTLRTGWIEYDDRIVIVRLDTAQALVGRGDTVLGIEFRVPDRTRAWQAARKLDRELGEMFTVQDWCELNKFIFDRVCTLPPKVDGTRAEHKSGCDKSNAASCRQLGRMLDYGQDGARDSAAARVPLARACELKDASACHLLGAMHARGRGGPIDMDKARDLLTRACDANEMAACTELAQVVIGKSKTPPPKTVALFEKACQGGHAEGCLALADLASEARDQAKVDAAVKRACDLNDPLGCLAYSQTLQFGTQADLAKATAVAEKAYADLEERCAKTRSPVLCSAIPRDDRKR